MFLSLKQRFGLLFLFSLLLLPQASWSWGGTGHGAIGEIAEAKLTPKAKAFVRSILGIEPLSVAAAWPDDVRSDERFKDKFPDQEKFGPYHFITIPDGMTYENMPDDQRRSKDAHVMIVKSQEALLSSKYTREQKMILMRYLIHLVGDVHQPLHVGNELDRGGNLCDINIKSEKTGQSRKYNLHSYWDSSIIDEIGYRFKDANRGAWFGYKELADLVLADAKKASAALNEPVPVDYKAITASTKLTDWYAEAKAFHHGYVYPDPTPTTSDKRPYCQIVDKRNKVIDGSFDASKIPTLGADYLNKAIALTKIQILRGGYRLAALLNSMAEKQNATDKVTEAESLKGIMFTLEHLNQNRQPQNIDTPHGKAKGGEIEPH